ncbi:MAG TPA: PQQ-binding-like beta-propeller repeat protein [Frankiaceae bacterium]|nr:PQQ-binding-like beta-propeller repeat protein [Frankiaceae bacterium]
MLLPLATVVVAGCGSSAAGPAQQAPSSSVPASSSAAPLPSTSSGSAVTSAWPGYHFDQARTAAVPAGASLAKATRAWAADLGGAVYGQPLIADGKIIAATETNRVVALNPSDGKVLWSASLGSPLTDVQSAAGCGNIDPLGITSTPVIDTASGTVYVVGEVASAGTVHHQLEGLRIATGAVTLSENVDPPLPSGESPVNLLQRASLALANGRVYVSYGGNYGDCGSYHGWVVGVEQSGAANKISFEVASDGEGGAIWQSGGAPAVDASGNLYVTTGNANPDPPEGGPDPKKYTESVVKLSPDLKPLASFKDQVAGGDEDLSTSNPVLLPNGTLFATGKTQIGFVLTQSDLSQKAAIKGVCTSDPDGGPAYDAATNRLFVPCRQGGIQVIDLTTNKAGAVLSGANSSPILIGTSVWAAQYRDGKLTEYDAPSGKTLQSLDVGSQVPNFTSPSYGLGLLLVGTTSGVTALHGT